MNHSTKSKAPQNTGSERPADSEILLLSLTPSQWVTFHSLCDQYGRVSDEVELDECESETEVADGEGQTVASLMRDGVKAEADPLRRKRWFPVILEAQRDSEYVILHGTITVETTCDGRGRVRGVTSFSEIGQGSTLTAGVYTGLVTLWQTATHLWVTVVAG